MSKATKTLTIFLILALANLFAVAPAGALFPPLPSSFYGFVSVNGGNVADGTTVRALINGQVYATAYTQTYEGRSVYSIDVPGDDPSTPAVEGGLQNDAMAFLIGEAQANETGTWKSATNVNLDLTASASAPLNTPQPTPTPVPTQTAIKTPKRNPTATSAPAIVQPSEPPAFPTLTLELPPAVTQPGSEIQPQPTQSGVGVPASTQPLPENGDQPSAPVQTRSGGSLFLIVLIILLAVIALWIVRALFRSKER